MLHKNKTGSFIANLARLGSSFDQTKLGFQFLGVVVTALQARLQQVRPLSGLAYIPTCRLPLPPAVASLSNGPRDCPASLSHLANDRPMHYRFFTFWPGANPWAKVHQKGRRPVRLLDLPSCKISSPYVNPCPRYPLPNSCGQRNKQTKRYIPTCLLACGDNKQ